MIVITAIEAKEKAIENIKHTRMLEVIFSGIIRQSAYGKFKIVIHKEDNSNISLEFEEQRYLEELGYDTRVSKDGFTLTIEW